MCWKVEGEKDRCVEGKEREECVGRLGEKGIGVLTGRERKARAY